VIQSLTQFQRIALKSTTHARFSPNSKVNDYFLSAARFEASTVAITIYAIALAVVGTPDKVADNSSCHSANSRSTPAIAYDAANNRA
jgi:hypothetical protein